MFANSVVIPPERCRLHPLEEQAVSLSHHPPAAVEDECGAFHEIDPQH